MIARFLLFLSLFATGQAIAQTAPRPPAPRPPVAPRTILFVGNSFTFGALSPVRRYRANAVTDLNRTGVGGMPALFKTFAEEARQPWNVSLETQGGMSLGFHWNERRQLLDRAWDVVILQEYSALDRERPGDATAYRQYAPMLAAMFARRNPRVDIQLLATWSRADMIWRPGSPWSGKPVSAMALDVRRAADGVKALSPNIRGVIPVGEAWNRAIATGLADPNPYDGIAWGQIDLWSWDQYHASAYGYYLEALVVFGRVTGIDPTTLGAKERAADDLGLSPEIAVALQRIARTELAAQRVASGKFLERPVRVGERSRVG